VLDAGGKIRLWVDNKEVGEAEQAAHLTQVPADGLSIGADTGSWVGDYRDNAPFSGKVRDLRLYWGLPGEKERAKWMGE
jgi:hypothetical protein